MSLSQLQGNRLPNTDSGSNWEDTYLRQGPDSRTAPTDPVSSAAAAAKANADRVASIGSAQRDGWRPIRVVALATSDGLLAALAVTLLAGEPLDVGVVVGVIALLALASVGAYRKSWGADTALSGVLARLLFAAITSIWLGSTLVHLLDGGQDISDPLLSALVLPLVWQLARRVNSIAAAQNRSRIVIVGPSELLNKLLRASNTRSSDEILGYFVSSPGVAPLESRDRYLGGPAALPGFLAAHAIDRVVIAGLEKESLAAAMRACDAAAVQIELHLPGLDGASIKSHLSFVSGVPVLRVREDAAPPWTYAVKRAIDVAGASCALVVLAPFLGLISIIALITQGRPLLFTQWRVGLCGEGFEILKFRTMSIDAEEQTSRFPAGVEAGLYSIGDAVSELKDVGRGHVTTFGAFLRATSLDELPQLWNVLRGDMSLVGPRPLRRFEHSGLDPSIAETRSRMRPGITGLWQVRGRSDVSWDERVNLDHIQVRNWTLREDVKILIETVPALFSGR
jgi:lipopolysaccharide/colanic/teichoic acid biosynthesis glycosyltransferase